MDAWLIQEKEKKNIVKLLQKMWFASQSFLCERETHGPLLNNIHPSSIEQSP